MKLGYSAGARLMTRAEAYFFVIVSIGVLFAVLVLGLIVFGGVWE